MTKRSKSDTYSNQSQCVGVLEMKPELFGGKCAILTGGASGVGRETGKQLFTQGLRSLAIVDDADPYGVCAQLRREFPHKHVVFVPADLSVRQCVRDAFDSVRSQFGDDKIDLVIGCGGGVLSEAATAAAATTSTEADDKRKAAAAACCLIQSINVTYEAIDAMSLTAGGRGGTIAHLSPISHIHDISRVPPFYTTTTHAIVGLMRSLAHDHYHRKHGISFITFCPTSLAGQNGRKQPAVPMQRVVIVENVQKLAHIRSEKTGRFFVEAVATAKNNSVWVVHKDVLRELCLPSHSIGLPDNNNTKRVASK